MNKKDQVLWIPHREFQRFSFFTLDFVNSNFYVSFFLPRRSKPSVDFLFRQGEEKFWYIVLLPENLW